MKQPCEQTSVVKSSQVPEPFENKRREQLYGSRKEALPPQKISKPAFSKGEEELFSGTLREKQKEDEQKLQKEIQIQKESPKPEQKILTESNVPAGPAETEHPKELPQETTSLKEEQQELPADTEVLREPAPAEEPVKQEEPKQLELFEEKLLAPESRSRIQLIGQIFDTYWLVQFEDNFYIIDQHAAHEKVYYERLVKQFREHSINSQYLNPPMIVSLSMQEEEILKSNQEYFRQFGFEIEHFGGREYCISAVPSNLYGFTEEELFLEMLDRLEADNSKDALDVVASRIATMACKAAVKGNHAMSDQEAEKLIDELLTLENPYHCPHGRPTIIAMTKTELEKKFKRIV